MSAAVRKPVAPTPGRPVEISAARKNAALRALGWVALHVQRHRWQSVCPCCLHFNLMIDGSLSEPTAMICTNCGETDPQKIHEAQVKHIQQKLQEIEDVCRS